MTGTHDLRLVALSIVIALFAAYVALDVAGRIAASRRRARSLWIGGGAIAMGLGIWSMHYVGMLAYQLPIPVWYHLPTVAISLAAGIAASAVALIVVSRARLGWAQIASGGLIMGFGIAAMHYTGMAAMRLSAHHHYDPFLTTLSVLIAVAVACVALVLTFRARDENTASRRRKIVSGVVMGSAIPLMHYTGMAAVSFEPFEHPLDLSLAVGISSLGSAAIGSFALVALGLVMCVALLDRLVAAQRRQQELDAKLRQVADEKDELLSNELRLKDEFLAQELRLRDEGLSHVSHELRSPLTAIYGFATILRDGLAGELTSDQREHVDGILRNVGHLETLVTDLLEVPRSRHGKVRVELQEVSLVELVRDVLSSLRFTAEAKSITLSSRIEEGLPSATADPGRTRQILVNLIQNAIKFTPAGGSVQVEVRRREGAPGLLMLTVRDTGCGFEPELKERVFERLFQVAPGSGESSSEGLGLGLYICRELTQRQGGTIWVESEPGRGSTFSFTLPTSSPWSQRAPTFS
jgi:signal transduction histidine kinase